MSRRREVWLAVALMALVTAHEMWVLGLPYVRYFRYSWLADSRVGFAIHVAGVLAIAATQIYLYWVAIVASRRWQVMYFVIFTVAVFAEYGYGHALNRMTNAHDLDVAFENFRLWRPMAAAFIDWRAAVPAILVLLALAAGRPLASGHARRAATVALLVVALHSAYAINGFLRRAQDVGMASGAPVPTGSVQGLARAATMLAWNDVMATFQYHLRDRLAFTSTSNPDHHIVLIVDESISAGHLSLNGYPRPTTPWLDEIAARGRLTNWGSVAAATNDSNGSSLCLVTGVNQLPDRERLSLTQPTIFQYAKAMHYRTHLLDGEAHGRRTGLSWDDMQFVDDFRPADAFGDDADSDFRMARAVKELLKEPAGQFVIVFKRGNHFPHQMNYPAHAGPWRPSNDEPVQPADAANALTNTYDNGIRYNLDAFFRILLNEDGTLPRTVVLYTSDHGEVLSGEGSRPISRVIAWGMAAVPLFMVGDARPEADTTYRPSHHNVFPTLLDLMAVPPSARVGSFRRSLLSARGADRDPRFVLGGFVLDEQGFDLVDFDSLQRPAALGVQPPAATVRALAK